MTRRKSASKPITPRFAIGDTVEVRIADVTSDMHGAIGTVVAVELDGNRVLVMFDGYAERGFEPDGFYACDLGEV